MTPFQKSIGPYPPPEQDSITKVTGALLRAPTKAPKGFVGPLPVLVHHPEHPKALLATRAQSSIPKAPSALLHLCIRPHSKSPYTSSEHKTPFQKSLSLPSLRCLDPIPKVPKRPLPSEHKTPFQKSLLLTRKPKVTTT